MFIQYTTPIRQSRNISLSENGQYQTAIVEDDVVYISSDYGNTWVPKITYQYRNWTGVAISSTGQFQSVVSYDNLLYISEDYCVIWSSMLSFKEWTAIDI